MGRVSLSTNQRKYFSIIRRELGLFDDMRKSSRKWRDSMFKNWYMLFLRNLRENGRLSDISSIELSPINKEFFSGDGPWREFKKQNNAFDKIAYNEEKDVFYPVPEAYKIIKDNFIMLYRVENGLEDYNTGDNDNEGEDDIPNILKPTDYIEKYGERISIEDYESEFSMNQLYGFPTSRLTTDDIRDILRMESSFHFLFNKHLNNDERIDLGMIDTVYTKRVEILRRREIDFNERFIFNYEFKCPKCNRKIEYETNELFKSTIEHNCPGEPMRDDQSQGDDAEIMKLNRDSLIPATKSMYAYEVEFIDEDGRRIESEINTLYSFDPNLEEREYRINIIILEKGEKNKNKDNSIPYILAYEEQKSVIDQSYIDEEDTASKLKEKNLPYSRFAEALYAIRRYYRVNHNININDSGYLLQIFLTLSILARLIFNFDKLAVSVIGPTSVSKTFIAQHFLSLVDRKLTTIGGGTATQAGLLGGQGKELVNGKVKQYLHSGVISRDIFAIMDECSFMYSNGSYNENILKKYHDKHIHLEKIGAQGKRFIRFTPVLLMNKFEHHYVNTSDSRVVAYENEIKKNYKRLVRKNSADYDFPHETDPVSVTEYLESQNFYLPLQYYRQRNEWLEKAIFFVRNSYVRKELDWKTGGKLASAHRIIFDVIVETQQFKDDEEMSDEEPSIFTELPVLQFRNMLKDYYKGDEEIDIKRKEKNSEKKNEQLNSLLESAKEFYNKTEAGRFIKLHLRNSTTLGSILDQKIFYNMRRVAVIIELLDNPEAIELSENTKRWLLYIFLKNKRGLTVSEYDFKKNDYRPAINLTTEMKDRIYEQALFKEAEEWDEMEKKYNIEKKKEESQDGGE